MIRNIWMKFLTPWKIPNLRATKTKNSPKKRKLWNKNENEIKMMKMERKFISPIKEIRMDKSFYCCRIPARKLAITNFLCFFRWISYNLNDQAIPLDCWIAEMDLAERNGRIKWGGKYQWEKKRGNGKRKTIKVNSN